MALNMTITMIKKHQEQNGNFETIQTMSEARQKYDTSRKTLIDLCNVIDKKLKVIAASSELDKRHVDDFEKLSNFRIKSFASKELHFSDLTVKDQEDVKSPNLTNEMELWYNYLTIDLDVFSTKLQAAPNPSAAAAASILSRKSLCDVFERTRL